MMRPLLAACALALSGAAQADIAVSPVVQGLDEPWGFGFLPGGEVIITERGGDLLLLTPGAGSMPSARNRPKPISTSTPPRSTR